MKNLYSVFIIVFLGFGIAKAQVYPPLEMSADSVIAITGGTTDISLRAGTNWQNITTINGTIQFDTTVISYNSMSYWGLSFPAGATFTYQGGGIITWTWTSLITIGPTLSDGDIVFTLNFNVVGNPGDVSPYNMISNPQALFWANGFAWSGNNFTLEQGLVTLICGAPTSAWTSTDNLFTVNFTDQSSSSVFSQFWDFGDGNTSTLQNPSHTYATGGMYTVCQVVTDSCGTDSTCQTINVCPTPTVAFTSAGNELSYAFTDGSSATSSSWFWDFGDGNTSTMQSPAHVYAAPGNYTVCLVASNACGSDSSCNNITVTCAAPDAMFTDSIDGLNFIFTDQSTNSPTSWMWDFGDGNTSTMQNPAHTFAAPGLYTVCLVATSICGTDSFCVLETAICAQPEAGFSYTSNMASVQFTDTSSLAPTSWSWDFGDGNTSTMQSPAHTYASSGTYLVCLVATSICGSDTVCDSVNIVIVGREFSLTNEFKLYPNPSAGQVRVSLGADESILEVSVLDVTGRTVANMNGNENSEMSLDLSELPSGAYFIAVEGRDGRYVKRLILE